MPSWLLELRIQSPAIVIPVYTLAVLLGLYLLLRPPAPTRAQRAAARERGEPARHRRMPTPGSLSRTVGAAVLGGAAGYFVCWLTGDVWDMFGITLTAVTRAWIAAAFAGVAVALVNLVRSRWWRVVVACVSVPVFVTMAALGVNNDFGAYPTIGEALGISTVHTMTPDELDAIRPSPQATPVGDLLATWQPQGSVPKHGKVAQVDIPAPVSRFPARPAMLYLPPAALVRNAPKLPVIIAISGQPGSPSNMFDSGQMPAILDAYAAAHRGLAPIVVVPDQLGAPDRNPMCVDSPVGNSLTYLTIDVPAWIKDNLTAAAPGRAWAVAGFSQGGTCSIQLGAGFPELFGTILAISGEVEPTMGADTVNIAFGGSKAKYDAAMPVNILAAHAPYKDSVAIFGVGQDDAKYTARMHTIEAAAKAANMATSTIISPGTAHDWKTVRYVMSHRLPTVADRLLSVP